MRYTLCLLAASFSFSACQTLPGQPPFSQPEPLSQLAAPVLETGQVHVRLQLPGQTAQGFQVQRLPFAAIAYIQAEISGPGLAQPLWPEAADADGLIPVTLSANPQTLELTLSAVPYGPLRQIALRFYTAGRELIPGAEVLGVTHVMAAQTQAEVSFRTTPVARIIQALLPLLNTQPELSSLDLAALQTRIESWLNPTGQAPDLSYETHPTLLNAQAIATALLDNQLNIASLTSQPAFFGSASLNGSITGMVAGDSLTLQLSDPASPLLQLNENGSFAFAAVTPGTWQLTPVASTHLALLENAQNQPYGNPELSLEPGVAGTAPAMVFRHAQPQLSQLTVEGGGEVALTLNGQHFHPSLAANELLLNGSLINVTPTQPAANHLRYVLPASVAEGTYTLQIRVGLDLSVGTSVSIPAPVPLPRFVFLAPVNGKTQVFTMRSDGTGLLQLTDDNAASKSDLILSPDGSKVAFRWLAPDNLSASIASVNLDGTGFTQITTPSNGQYDYHPVWSADGSQIVFSSNRNTPSHHLIYSMHADGSQIQQLSSGSQFNNSPTWTPDGRILFSGAHGSGEIDLMLMDADGSNLSLYTNTTAPDTTAERWPRYSPDQQFLAYTSLSSNGTDYRLHMQNLGTGQTEIISEDLQHLVFAWLDSETLIFRHRNASGLYQIKRDGTGLALLPGQPVGASGPGGCVKAPCA